MATKRPQLAKLTRPRLHKAVARERLFALLDEAREHKPAICVVGPPGAGKTTLVASWLDARSLKGIWYQVDPGDADLATFFYYLGEEAKAFTRKGQRPLPLLTPEYLHDVEGFARRFFRELFARLPEGATLVLDNYQEVAPEQAFHPLIANAVDEVPEGMTLFVVSRRDPPDCYARLLANDHVTFVDWDALKLTVDEAAALGSARQDVETQEIARLHELSGGWAAGLVLLLERLRRSSKGVDVTSPDSLRDVFNYFAGQLVEQFDATGQKVLMQMSYLPRMTAPMAVAITGTPSAAGLLEELHRRHLFTDCRVAQQPVYQFHALFQAFLQYRAEQTLSATEHTQTLLHAARLLEDSGHPEEAFPLALKGGDFSLAVAITLHYAGQLIGQGRWRVVVEWVEALPKQLVTANCWLLHWQGTALIAVDPPKARAILEASFTVAEAASDDLCQVQAAAGIIQTYMLEYVQFRPLDRWIEVLQPIATGRLAFPSVDAELRAQAALLVALAYRRPDHPAITACAERVLGLVQSDAEVNLRTLSTAYLVVYGDTTGPLHLARRTRPILERLVRHPEVTVLTAGWSLFVLAYSHMVDGNEDAGRAVVVRLEGLGMENDLPPLIRLAAIMGAWLELGAGKLGTAREWADKVIRVMVPGHPYDMASIASIEAWIAMFSGHYAAATEPVKQAVSLYEQAGTHFHRCYSCYQMAMNRIALGDAVEAERFVAMGLNLARSTRTVWLEVEGCLAKAFIAQEQGGSSGAKESLRRALALAKQIDCPWPFKFMLPWMPRLCVEALRSGIEVEYTRKVIRHLGLRAPSLHVENWPWPIRLHTLGQFQVLIDDKLLAFSRKTPKRPIALLKAIIALGGQDVPAEKLVDALWPELEGDAGEEAFNQALHRLRRLLGSAEAVLLEDGKASLNEALVWTDVRAFEELLGQDQPNGDHEALFRLYRGQFLAEEGDATWGVSLRERLRSKFVHKVEEAGLQLEAIHRWREAIALYLRGLDADSLNEAFYQGLMRCYASLDNRAEAMSVYRRLREQLSIVLGMKPSSSSEALARELRLQ